LAATSFGWGLWDLDGGMAGALSEVDRARFTSAGITALSPEQGLAAFDEALATGQPFIMPVRFDKAALRGQARSGELRHVLRKLGGVAHRPRADDRRTPAELPLRDRLGQLGAEDRARAIEEVVLRSIATVLGHTTHGRLASTRSFKELGFDSVAAVELRNKLSAATGLSLPATLVFDHPSPLALAQRLDALTAPSEDDVFAALLVELDKAGDRFSSGEASDAARTEVVARMRHVLAQIDHAAVRPAVQDATDDEIFDLIDNGLNVS
jgi:hypothetical protein